MRVFFTLSFLLSSILVFGQAENNKRQKLADAKIEVENSLLKNLNKFKFTQGILNREYHFLNEDLSFTLEDGFKSKIQYLDETGFPTIFIPHNLNAAVTTGANNLQPGGALGLSLTGKGLVVGIFDQTRPKPDHVEFQGRLTQIDGSTEVLSTHSTHVSGTILAAGINPTAKGMAYEATGWSFNWDNDASKMFGNAYDPDSKPNGFLVSNHSYGVGLGWSGSTWVGNPAIDPKKDYRFGFYSSKSQAIDDLIYSRPYYSVVWSAGNDRDDRGDGTRDPDGPEDTIGPEGVAKNNFTIGAVESVLNYSNPLDIKMSSFSSWGPTDDGRIKPDLVAMGVNVFSASISGGNDSYASQSGTSMAAPNVTGSLFLLQELFSQRNSGKFMLASTLKALAIQTAKEAGPAPGPDYMFGWGLLDVSAGAEIILKEDGASNVIREEILGEDEVFEFEFVSDGIQPIRATIVWTDPAGTPPGAALNPTDRMLVNDLDLRIFDEDGKEFFPWTLDRSKGAAAQGDQSRDNILDNVEQVMISSPQSKKYKVQVSHKGDLKFGVQQFSLVFTAGVLDAADETLYWIGNSEGDWNNTSNWSSTLNGPSANKIPSEASRVVFEGGASGNLLVNFPSDVNVFSINLFGNQLVTFDLKGNDIKVSNGFRVSNQITDIKNGKIIFNNSTNNDQLVELGKAIFDNVLLEFSSGSWQLIEVEKLDQVLISNAKIKVGFGELNLNSLTLSGSSTISGIVNTIKFSRVLSISNTASFKEGIALIFNGTSGQFENNSSIEFDSLKIATGNLSINTNGFKSLEIVSGKVFQKIGAIEVNELKLGSGSELNLDQSGIITVLDSISIETTEGAVALISSTGKGKLIHDIYKKYCFENLSISNVDHQGEAIINLGVGASVSNATGWLSQNCADVLFANFRSNFNCVGAAITFENLSEGSISSHLWDFGGKGTSTERNPIFVFDQEGAVNVKLTISNASGSTVFDQSIQIGENELAKPTIVVNGNVLTSQQPGTSYQWYINSKLVEGGTSRSLEVTGDGLYQVAIFNNTCNRVSDPIVISAIPDQEVDLSRFGIFVGPIPTLDKLNITISNGYRGQLSLEILDIAGRSYLINESTKTEEEIQLEMNLTGPVGLYILKINTNNLTLHKKVIKF